MLDLAQKRECIARLTAKSEGADRSAAEWSLHHLHVAARTRMRAAMKSSKNIPEKAPASTFILGNPFARSWFR